MARAILLDMVPMGVVEIVDREAVPGQPGKGSGTEAGQEQKAEKKDKKWKFWKKDKN